jgi:putative transposase
MLNKVHKIKLNPTKNQKVFFEKSFGTARFCFNWGLSKWQEDYKNGIKQSAYSLIKYLNSIKKQEFKWMQEVGKCCGQYAIHNVESAYKKMWKEKTGYPKFKKKGLKESFVAVENLKDFKQKDCKIWIPRLGWVKCCENLRFDGKVNNVVISKKAGIYFASINITSNQSPIISEKQAIVGVDLGIKKLATCSDGNIFENPKALKNNLKSLNRLQRGLIRKVKGSNNRKKAILKLSKKHYRVSCIRNNALHQATSFLSKNYGTIVIEDLNIKGMVKNRKLSQAILDVGFGEFSRQLKYKSKWYGCDLIVADRFYASSKICSCCGNKKDKLKLSERVYDCYVCDNKIDRDLNASKNLANLALLGNPENVKPVEQTQISNLDRVAMKQEFLFINILNN